MDPTHTGDCSEKGGYWWYWVSAQTQSKEPLTPGSDQLWPTGDLDLTARELRVGAKRRLHLCDKVIYLVTHLYNPNLLLFVGQVGGRVKKKGDTHQRSQMYFCHLTLGTRSGPPVACNPSLCVGFECKWTAWPMTRAKTMSQCGNVCRGCTADLTDNDGTWQRLHLTNCNENRL